MKKQLFSVLLLSFVFSVSAQKAQVAPTDATQSNLKRDIAYLASDMLEGRRTGSPGANAAAAYVADNFAKLRLKPGARSKNGGPNYMQPFPYVTGVEMAKTGNEFSLELTQPSGSRIKVDNMLPVKPVGFSPNAAVAPTGLVFAGFGVVSTDPKFDDYAGLDVKGKVVLVFDGYPDNDNPHSVFGRFDARTKALIAKDKGAVGMLLISRETNYQDDRLAKLGYDQSLGEAAIPTFVVSRNTAENILGTIPAGLKMIETLTEAKKDHSVSDIHINYRDTQPVVSFKVNLIKRSVDAYNVIGILPGTDPTLKNEAIVIGAHYDHLGHGGQGSLAANSNEIHHGADDNASGTAAIIELARQFAAAKKNKRTIIQLSSGSNGWPRMV
ncbi:MAG: M28 family peptidase, partial [Acidobacteriota bacterium]